MTPLASSESPRTPAWNRLFVIFICVFVLKKLCLEVHANAEGNEIAIIHRAVATTKEVGVVQARCIGVLILGIKPKADCLATFFEVTARTWGVTLDVMGPGHVRLQVHAGKDVAVIPDGTTAITPGSGCGETVVVAVAALVAG